MNKAVAYCRYSTDNQTENSIMYQLDAIQNYCKNNDYNLIDVYSDEAKSGTNTQRDNLQRLLDDCKKNKFNAVIIYDQSRLSRNVVDWFNLRACLSENNITLCSCNETLSNDIYDSCGFLTEGVKALFNQQFVLDTRKKSIAGKTQKAKQALFCGGSAPLGYDIIDRKYVVNEAEAAIIRTIFNMYANGYSYKDIMEKLLEKGYRTKNGNVIGTNAIYYLLINEKYTGTFVWNKYKCKEMRKRIPLQNNEDIVTIPNAIPAIIDIETWEKVQRRMSNNKLRAANSAKRDYMLTGLIECAKCGSTYTGFASKNKDGSETIYYTCGRKNRLKDCNAKNIRGDKLEKAVYRLIKENILNKKAIEDTAQLIYDKATNKKDVITSLKNEISKKTKAVDSLLSAIEKGLNTDTAIERVNTLQCEIKAIQEQIDTIPQDKLNISKQDIVEYLKRDIEKLDGSPKQQKAMFREYVKKIKISDNHIEIQLIGNLNINGGATQT